MGKGLSKPGLVVITLLLCLASAAAQVTLGDETNVSLQGSLSFGYSGAFGNSDVSSHGIDLGATGQMHGFYYDPRFLSFDFQPYYRRSQSNSLYQSITNGSGFTGSTNFFTGSHFPGSVFYTKAYDSTGQFGVPGTGGFTSHGNSQGYGITWSALLPDRPTLTASFSDAGGSSSVYGANTENRSSSRNFTLQSTYTLAGFQLQGQYTRLSMDARFPVFLQNGETQTASTGSNTFVVNAGHTAPLNGYWSIGWSRSTYAGAYRSQGTDGSNNGTINDVNTMLSLNPTRKLALGLGAAYNDNLYGSLQEQIFASGSAISLPIQSSSRTFSLNAQAGYTVFSHLALYGRVTHYQQWFAGRDRGLTQFSGNAAFNFAQRLLGMLTFSIGVIDTATDQGNSGASLVGNVNLLRRVHGWELGANFGYTQQVQTYVDVYTTSMYRYGGAAKRRFGRLQWLSSFNGSHSGLTQFDGFSSRTETFASSLHYGRYGINGQYSQSYGTSILTPGGLVPVPGVPGPLLPQPILYNANSYGGGVSVIPFRRVSLSANYAKANSDTTAPGRVSAFDSRIWNARLQYRLRKLDFDANFTRFEQNITSGTLPAKFNTYYVRVSRWFNVF